MKEKGTVVVQSEAKTENDIIVIEKVHSGGTIIISPMKKDELLDKSSPRKSLIPLPTDKLSRPALSALQKSGKPSENEMVGRQKTPIASKASGDVAQSAGKASTSKDKPATNKVRSGFITKRKYADKGIQTADIDLVTGVEAPLAYWKELAENRREALQEALQENENLHQRITDLVKENEVLEEMVQQAKTIAEAISSLPDFSEADESGFVADYDDAGTGFGTDYEDAGTEHDAS